MKSKFRWFDFADNSFTVKAGPTGGPQTLNLGGSGQPAAAPSRKSAGNDHDSKVHSAIAAKNKRASQGRKDRCKKGTSCGAACIFHNDECLVVFPDPGVQKAMGPFRDFLRSEVEKGTLTDAQANRMFMQKTGLDQVSDKKRDLRPTEGRGGKQKADEELGKASAHLKQHAEYFNKAMEDLKTNFPDEAERAKVIQKHINHAMRSMYGDKDVAPKVTLEGMESMVSPEQQARIKQVAEIHEKYKRGEYKSDEEFSKALEPFQEGYRTEKMTKGEVYFLMALAPPQVHTYAEGAGSSKIPGSFGSLTPASNFITKVKDKLIPKDEKEAKKFAIFQIAGESGFKDVWAPGQHIHMLSADLEHLIPAGVAGARANIGNNWGLTNCRLNRGHGEGSCDYFLVDNKNGWFNTSTQSTAKSKEGKQITFDSNGKITEEGRRLHETREGNLQNRKRTEYRIANKLLSPEVALEAIKSLPPDVISAQERHGLIGKIVAAYTGASRTVAIGIQSAKEGSLRSVPKPFYWYGKDVGGGALGQRLAETVAKLQKSGNEEGLSRVAKILAEAQEKLLRLNDLPYKGGVVRETQYATKTGLPDFLQPKIEAIQNEVAEAISKLG